MGFAALSDIRVIIAFWIGAVSILLAFLLLIEIIWLRTSLLLKSYFRETFETKAQKWLIRRIAGELGEMPTFRRRNLRDFMHLWIHYQEMLRGESTERLNQALLDSGFLPLIRKQLRRGSFEDRLLAVTLLGHHRDVQSLKLIDQLLDSASPLLSMTAAKALARIAPEQAQHKIVQMLIQRRDWVPVRVLLMLKLTDPCLKQALLDTIQREAAQFPPYLLRLVQYLENLPNNQALAVTQKLLANQNQQDSDGDLIAAGLRLICHPAEMETARKFFDDDHWAVQVQIASLISRLGSASDAHHLVKLLDSSQWWVRYRAAKALVNLPYMNHRAIKRLAKTRKDLFARNILQQILAEQDHR